MSKITKLEQITTEAYLNFGPTMSRDDNEVLATMNKQIKALMLDLTDNALRVGAITSHAKAWMDKEIDSL